MGYTGRAHQLHIAGQVQPYMTILCMGIESSGEHVLASEKDKSKEKLLAIFLKKHARIYRWNENPGTQHRWNTEQIFHFDNTPGLIFVKKTGIKYITQLRYMVSFLLRFA